MGITIRENKCVSEKLSVSFIITVCKQGRKRQKAQNITANSQPFVICCCQGCPIKSSIKAKQC